MTSGRAAALVAAVMEGHLDVHLADAASLAWLVMAGVDTPVDAVPRRWLRAIPDPAPAAMPVPQRVATAAAPPRGAEVQAAATLEALAEAVATFGHALRRADLAPALLSGNADCGVMILCDQPEPEGSPAGLLRARMLAAIGLDAGNSALLHRLPWPTTGARAPRADELAAFEPFVNRALELARPRLILALGQHAAAIAGEPMALASARGRWAMVGDTPLFATCHPRLLLSQPARKRDAWADLQAFSKRLAELA